MGLKPLVKVQGYRFAGGINTHTPNNQAVIAPETGGAMLGERRTTTAEWKWMQVAIQHQSTPAAARTHEWTIEFESAPDSNNWHATNMVMTGVSSAGNAQYTDPVIEPFRVCGFRYRIRLTTVQQGGATDAPVRVYVMGVR